MKIERILRATASSTNLSASHTFSHLKVSGLLIYATAGFQPSDALTVKMRHERTEVQVDRIKLVDLSGITDLNFGYSRYGSNAKVLNDFIGLAKKAFGAIDTAEAYGTTELAAVTEFQVPAAAVDCIYVPLGHVSLGQDAEMQVDLSFGSRPADEPSEFFVSAVYTGAAVDKLFIYDQIQDLESTHNMVRDIYLVKRDSSALINQAGVVPSVSIQLDVEGQTFTTDALDVVLASSIFSAVEGMQTVTAKLFSDHEGLPSEVRLKITGSDAALMSCILVKENLVPYLTSSSTVENLQIAIRKTEKMEAMQPEIAKAYRHAGITSKAIDLKAALDSVPPVRKLGFKGLSARR